ncbi:hypothetical protein, partial [Weissella confusa]|uniref:hypothetical protein n=1 Tax=Weissella confusa TaxID=1583 RepID=UPI001AEC3E2F
MAANDGPAGSAGQVWVKPKVLMLTKFLREKGARERILRPYYDPPFKCRVPKLNFMCTHPYSPKGFSHFEFE